VKSKYFTTGYIYIYSIGIVVMDTLTLSRDNDDLFNFEVFCGRLVVVFTYWIIVKNLSGMAERKGYSFKLALILGIIGLPAVAGALSWLMLQ
jgi:hypothetical protein